MVKENEYTDWRENKNVLHFNVNPSKIYKLQLINIMFIKKAYNKQIKNKLIEMKLNSELYFNC